MNELDTETKQKIWAEILEQIRADTQILPGEKSIKMFAEEAGISENTAKSVLDKYIEEKKMRKRFVQQGRARIVVYSPIA